MPLENQIWTAELKVLASIAGFQYLAYVEWLSFQLPTSLHLAVGPEVLSQPVPNHHWRSKLPSFLALLGLFFVFREQGTCVLCLSLILRPSLGFQPENCLLLGVRSLGCSSRNLLLDL